MRVIVLSAALAVLLVGPANVSPVDPQTTHWVESATFKIKPGDPSGGEQSVSLKAAKNEYESFQVAFQDAEPSTSSLVSAFGFDGWDFQRGHFGDTNHWDQVVPLSVLCAKAALMNRVTLSSMTQEDRSILVPPTELDWSDLDGNNLPSVKTTEG